MAGEGLRRAQSGDRFPESRSDARSLALGPALRGPRPAHELSVVGPGAPWRPDGRSAYQTEIFTWSSPSWTSTTSVKRVLQRAAAISPVEMRPFSSGRA